jgi:hypothetical protein
MPLRRRTLDDVEIERARILDLVRWGRAGFDASFTPGRNYGLYLRGTAELDLARGRLSSLDYLLFLLALCRRTDPSLVSYVLSAILGAAVRAACDETLPAADGQLLDGVLAQAEAIPELAGLRKYVLSMRAVREEQAVQRERERDRERARQARMAERTRLRAAVAQIMALAQTPFAVAQPPGALDLRDGWIALAWTLGISVADAARRAPDRGTLLKRFAGDRDFRRNLSARAAERAAARIYAQVAADVRDVAGDETGAEWTTHDLLADGRPVDVKNVRSRRHRRTHLVEEARVTRFKRTAAGVPVAIAGTRSALLPPEALLDPRDEDLSRDVEYLGEISESRFEALVEEFGRGPLEMDFSRPVPPDEPAEYYLPHWMFDYPAAFYAGRDEAASRVQPWLFQDRWFWGDDGKHPLAFALMAGLDMRSLPGVDAAPWQARLFATLLDRRARLGNGNGMSLPVLYLSLLEHFLPLAGAPAPPRDFSPDGYRRLLFFDAAAERRRWPAGVYDPHGTVDALIGHLQVLWGRRAELGGLRRFRLNGREVLQGRAHADEGWTTLVAYCGDCRFKPLVLGSHAPCPHCRRLVCRQCNFCSAPPRDGSLSPEPRPERSCRGGPRLHARSV